MKSHQEQENIVLLKCPSCGGSMELDQGGRTAVCPYCGQKLLLKNAEDPSKKAYEYHKAKELAAADARDEIKKRGRRRAAKAYLIVGLLFLVLCGIGVLIPGTSFHVAVFPKKADPFENVSVTFVGDSGSGRAQVKGRGSGELRDVEFTVTPSENLENGDEVTVKAGRVTGYRWEPAEKTYTVEGLAEWIRKTDAIPASELTKLHENTERLIDEDWEEIAGSSSVTDITVEPYRLYLFVARDEEAFDRNFLYDSYKVTVTRDTGEELVTYEACRYANLKLQPEGDMTAEYGSLLGFHLGYLSGFASTSSFSGWLDAAEMEADLKNVRDGYLLAE